MLTVGSPAVSYNPNANSFTPGGGNAPPFQPGQPYNPYASQAPPADGQQQYADPNQQYYAQQYGGELSPDAFRSPIR